MTEEKRCFPCIYPGKYPIESVRWLKAEDKLCENHLKKAEVMIEADDRKNKPFQEKAER